MVAPSTTFLFLYPCITASPWGSPECRPKQVGEHFMNKIHHKIKVRLLVIYIFLDLIIVRMDHVKITYPYTHLLVEFVITRLCCHTLFTSRCNSIFVTSTTSLFLWGCTAKFLYEFPVSPMRAVTNIEAPAQILYSRSLPSSHGFIRCYYSFCLRFKKLYETHPISYKHLLHCSNSSVFYEVYSCHLTIFHGLKECTCILISCLGSETLLISITVISYSFIPRFNGIKYNDAGIKMSYTFKLVFCNA